MFRTATRPKLSPEAFLTNLLSSNVGREIAREEEQKLIRRRAELAEAMAAETATAATEIAGLDRQIAAAAAEIEAAAVALKRAEVAKAEATDRRLRVTYRRDQNNAGRRQELHSTVAPALRDVERFAHFCHAVSKNRRNFKPAAADTTGARVPGLPILKRRPPPSFEDSYDWAALARRAKAVQTDALALFLAPEVTERQVAELHQRLNAPQMYLDQWRDRRPAAGDHDDE